MTKYNTGDKVNGYTFVKEYPHFNLWKRNSSGIKECFRKNELPKQTKVEED